MARKLTAGYELAVAAGFDSTMTAVLTGAVTRDTTNQRTGVGCMKCDSAAGNAAAFQQLHSNLAVGANYLRAYIRFAGLPTAAARVMGSLLNIGVSVRLTTGGKLQLWNNVTETQIGSDSAATVSPGSTDYRIELSVTINASPNITDCELRVDGTSVASASGLSLNAATFIFRVGWLTAPGANKILYVDDVAINDTTGSANTSWPGEGKVLVVVPTADSAGGTGWTLGTGTALGGNGFAANDNIPPLGVADLTAGSDPKQIRNATANANDSVDLTMQSYTAAGVPSGATITAVAPVVCTASPVATGAKAGTVGVVSNPTITNVALAAGGTAGAFWSGAAAAAFPTGWKWSQGTHADTPSVTLGTAPVMRLTQVTSSTRIAMSCFAGLYIEYVVIAVTYDDTPSGGIVLNGTAPSISPATTARRLKSASSEKITLGLGTLGSFGPGTIAFLYKPAVNGTLRTLFASSSVGTTGIEFRLNTGDLLQLILDGNIVSAGAPAGNHVAGRWYLGVVTKGSGTSQVRFHVYDFTSGVWQQHQTSGATPAASTAPTTRAAIGVNRAGNANFFDGEIRQGAVWNVDMTDAQVEELLSDLRLAAWSAVAAPVAMWTLDQQSLGATVTDLTGNGASQTAITGTSWVNDFPGAVIISAPSGGIVLGGSRVTSKVYPQTPSGGIRLGGTVVAVIPVALTVRLKSGGTVIASRTHNLTGEQARVSWVELTLPYAAAGAPTVYTDAPSGGIRLGGSVTDTRALTVARSAGIVLGGTVAVARTFAQTPSGGIRLAGTAAVTRTFAKAPSAGIRLGGSTVNTRALTLTRSAGLVLGGSVAVTRTVGYTRAAGIRLAGTVVDTRALTLTRSGGLVLGGTAASSRSLSLTRSAGIVLNGTCTSSISAGTFVTPSGGIRLAGTATSARTLALTRSAGIVLGGTAVSTRAFTKTPSGGVRLSGTVSVTRTLVLTRSAGLVLGGSAAVTRTLVLTRSAGLVLGGSRVTAKVYPQTPTGGIRLAGTTTSSRSLTVTRSAGLVLGGTAAVLRTFTKTPSAGIRLAGSVAISRSYTPAPSAGIRLAGTAASIRTLALTRSAGIRLFGTATSSIATANAVFPQGGIRLNGAAANSRTLSLTRSAGIVLGGSRTQAITRTSTVSAGVRLGGTTVNTRTLTLTRSAGIRLSGTATSTIATAGIVAPVGGIRLNGSVVVLRTFAKAPSGGIKLGGTAANDRTLTLTRSAGIKLSGTCSSAIATSGTSVPVGGIRLAGSATVLRSLTYTRSAGIVLGGSTVVLRASSRPLADTGLVLGSSLLRQLQLTRGITTAGLTLTDSLATERRRQLTHALTISDSLARNAALRVRAAADTALTIGDSVSVSLVEGAVTFDRAVADAISISDSLTSLRQKTRPAADTGLALTDATTTKRTHAAADTGLTLTDSVVVHHAPAVPGDVGLSLGDSLVRQALRVRSVTSTGITVTDSVARPPRAVARTTSDVGLSISDDIDRVYHPIFGHAYDLEDTGLTLGVAVRLHVTRRPFLDVGLVLTDTLGKHKHKHLLEPLQVEVLRSSVYAEVVNNSTGVELVRRRGQVEVADDSTTIDLVRSGELVEV
jgi:hypothetical protein